MSKTVIIENKQIQLDSSQLIQSGGEGMVFKVGQTAVKLYHNPQSHHKEKLIFFFKTGLPDQLPPEILAPLCPVTNNSGEIIGFQMPYLPPNAQPIKSLSKASYWQKGGLTTTAVLTLFQKLHTTLTTLHNLGIIVGDLNDQNIFIQPNPKTNQLDYFLIDVDSYQFGRFPCPVAMDLFVDPNLYGIANLGQRPFFSPATDWYAFFVLLVRSLLYVHPYGGVHHQHKNIAARAQAGISILQLDIKYPINARPPEILSDGLLNHLHRVFERGERPPFPALLLADYANNLTQCSHCQQAYPQERPFCPSCTHTPATTSIPKQTQQLTHLHTTAGSGTIESLHTLPNGRFLAIIFAQNHYKLMRMGPGGILNEMALFNGSPGYRFAAFQDNLVVNPPHSKQLLLLDISSKQPRKHNMLETALFRETAVFSATPTHLFRIAGTWIMRGSIQNGHFIEEPITTAHHKQTWFQASPINDTIVGYHRVFTQNHFFLWHERSSHDISMPPLPPGESLMETAVTFKSDAATILLKINEHGHTRTAVYHVNHQGKIQQASTAQTPQPPDHRTLRLPKGTLQYTPTEIWYHSS